MDVRLSDSVYVLGFGPGTVVRVLPGAGGFVVNVPGRGDKHFTVDGCVGVGTDRRVYFQNPIVVEPPRNKKLWDAYVDLSRRLFELIGRLDKSGDLPDA
jgi:hypothetical protein